MIIDLVTVLSAPVMYAREGRQGRGDNGTRTEQSRNSGQNAPGRRGHSNRPDQRNNHPDNRNHDNRDRHRHDNRHSNRNRPDNRHGNWDRPHFGGNHHGGYRPAPPPPPRHDHWPRYHRPTPPPRYVCGPRCPSFGSIMGMVLGTAYNVSLSYLYNNGYTVAGYADNAIYINNVSQMNCNWPNAVLHYNNGMLCSSQYIYSTTWQDPARYNRLYNSFCQQYGYPASVSNTGVVMSASWFGYDGRFVTIQYSPGYNSSGMACYYTTLSFGN